MAVEHIKPVLSESLLLQALEQLTAVAEQIGVLQGQVNLVISENHRAADLRQQMIDKLSRIDGLEGKLDRIIPLVDKHEEKHNQTVGAMHFGKWIWTVIAGGAGAALLSIAEWLSGTHPPHH